MERGKGHSLNQTDVACEWGLQRLAPDVNKTNEDGQTPFFVSITKGDGIHEVPGPTTNKSPVETVSALLALSGIEGQQWFHSAALRRVKTQRSLHHRRGAGIRS
jgi:hypothetical protein